MTKKKKIIWISVSVLLLIVLIVIAKSKGEKGTKVAVEKVAAHTILETVSATGKIYPEIEVKISPEVSGEITELHVEEGDSVHKGQLLLKINSALYSSIVNQASASVKQSRSTAQNVREMVEQSRSQYELAKNTYERNKKLYEDKVISRLEFEQSEANWRGAKASYEAAKANASGSGYGVDAAQANLSQAAENLRKTIIVAPVSGIVSQLAVKKGERVVGTAQMAGTELLTIADMTRLEVRVDVSETDIAKVKLNDTCYIEADAYRSRKFKGVVSKIAVSSGAAGLPAAASTDQVTNYTVHIFILPARSAERTATLPRGRFVFKPGMSSSVTIQTRKESGVLSVPVSAVQAREWPDSLRRKMRLDDNLENNELRKVVFVYRKDKGTVEMRDVKTGLQDNEFIQITEGLKDGEEVVTAPYGAVARLLKDKSAVRVVKKEELFDDKSED